MEERNEYHKKKILLIIKIFIVTSLFYVCFALVLSLIPIFANVIPYSFSNPKLLNLQHLYYGTSSMRSVIQGDVGCFELDNKIGYKQLLGECYFENFEFSTVLKFDKNGSKVSDGPKNKEKILILGDSITMGWGVNYDETYPYLMSEKGYNVASYAMSSHGTEQEILSVINKPVFEEAEFILIQYCSNDLKKNIKNIDEYISDEYKIKKEQNITKLTLEIKLRNALNYYLKKASFNDILKLPLEIIDSSFNEQKYKYKELSSLEHKKNILRVIGKYKKLKEKKIIIFYVNSHNIRFDTWNEYKDNIIFYDFKLDDEHFYKLDDHPNKYGHLVLANKIDQFLSEKNYKKFKTF